MRPPLLCSAMAKTSCVICGLETFRLVFNEPLCPNCDPIGTGVVILRERMYTAKEEYWQLLKQGERLNSEAVARTHGIPHPDSIHRIENLSKLTREAFEKYQKAPKIYFAAITPWDRGGKKLEDLK